MYDIADWTFTAHLSNDPEEHPAKRAKRMVEEPVVAVGAGYMAPFALAAEIGLWARQSRGLAMRWSTDLAKCTSLESMLDVNSRYGERAMALGYSKAWRVLERSAEMSRSKIAPSTFEERDAS